VEDTLRALELGSVETLICWENLDIQRYVLKNHANSTSTTVLHLTPEQVGTPRQLKNLNMTLCSGNVKRLIEFIS